MAASIAALAVALVTCTPAGPGWPALGYVVALGVASSRARAQDVAPDSRCHLLRTLTVPSRNGRIRWRSWSMGQPSGGMGMDPGMHQIGEAADKVGLSLRTIRHYEDVGLVPPSGRSAGGFRLYTDEDIDRLRLVKHMKPLDFSLEEMRDLLQARDRLAAGIDDPEERDRTYERLAMYATAAEQRCESLRAKLEAAESMADQLRREAHRRPAHGPR